MKDITAALLLSACSTAPHYCAEPYLSCQDRDGGSQIDNEPVRAYPHNTTNEPPAVGSITELG